MSATRKFANCSQVFSTCPQSKDFPAGEYPRQVERVARWSDAAGCAGMLIYTDNSIVDPWLVAQSVLCSTRHLCPLVAVQPIYMPPYTAAKMVASLSFLHGRRIWLNMLAGGFRNDLIALGDETPHDERYARTIEYSLLMRRLLERDEPISFSGRYYAVRSVRMTPSVPAELIPGFLISGSSPAGQAAAAAIGATAVEYPGPAGLQDRRGEPGPAPPARGIRIGIIARDNADEAWRVAYDRFPDDRRGRLSHALAMKTSDSAWHRTLSAIARERSADSSPYWLWPFEHHQTFCPYLVGDFPTVAGELARYQALGYGSFILDIPREAIDLETAAEAFRMAADRPAALSPGAPSSAGSSC
jgi:alkanesulfonate monooxygenase